MKHLRITSEQGAFLMSRGCQNVEKSYIDFKDQILPDKYHECRENTLSTISL